MALLINSYFTFTIFLLNYLFFHADSVTSTTPSHSNSVKNRPRKWVGPSGTRHISVNVHGFGDYQSVQAAVDSIPQNNNMNIIIDICPGYYM